MLLLIKTSIYVSLGNSYYQLDPAPPPPDLPPLLLELDVDLRLLLELGLELGRELGLLRDVELNPKPDPELPHELELLELLLGFLGLADGAAT